MTPILDINLVITLYEEEERNLLKLIADSIEEQEFLISEYHTKALHIIKQKLYQLNCLNDSNYKEKHRLQMYLANMSKMLSSNKYDVYKGSLIHDIESAKTKLYEISQTKSIKERTSDADLMQNYIRDLLKNKISKLSLLIDQKDNLRLDFKKKGRTVQILIPDIKKVLPDYLEDIDCAAQFRKLGFYYSKNKLVLTLHIVNKDEYIDISIMKIVSQVCIDIFGVTTKKHDSVLIVEGKASR